MVLNKIRSILNPPKIKNWYQKYENRISSLALVFGFVLDNLSLGRVDALADQLILSIYILISGFCIIMLSLYESDSIKEKIRGRMHFWMTLFMQFSLGALFSAFVVFYTRSSTLESSWPFLLLLVIYLLGNEFLKKHYEKFSFRVSVYFFALLSYLIITIPILLNSIDRWVFIVSSIVTIIIFILFLWFTEIVSKISLKSNKKVIAQNALVILVIVNIFYFLNLIPPLPLIQKDAGVYHNLKQTGDGGYLVDEEIYNRFNNFLSGNVFHRYNFEPVYIMTAIYSPIDLNINITHNWQKFDNKSNKWITISNINVPIRGGRQDGYRLYSVKSNVAEGLWRVNVLTSDHRVIGRLKFDVKNVAEPFKVSRINK